MKNILFISLVLFLLASSCKKKTIEPLFGTISSMSFDGKPMQRAGTRLKIRGIDETSRCKNPEYGILISLHSINDTLVEQLSVGSIPMSKTGIIKLSKRELPDCDGIPEVGFGMMRQFDMVVAGFSPMKNADNYINIHSFDTKTKEVKGNLKVTLVNDFYGDYHKAFGYRDTIVFESGDFTVRLQ